ncbi:MAG: HD-GYP domain-containing protein [Bacillota bacterium]
MRRIFLKHVQPGMVLGRTILGSAGQVLLNAGAEIKPQYMAYLKNMGINTIYVQDSRMGNVEISDVISEEIRRETRFLVKEIIEGTQGPASRPKGLAVYNKRILQAVSRIIEELLANKDMLVQLTDIRALGDYLFAHSVNCCVLATLTAIKMNLNDDALKCLATGALLHDLGMVAVPENITCKITDLTHDEYETVKNHPRYGFELFKKSPLFSARAGAVIMQHHERYNGLGYPQGLTGNKINRLAQITAVADVYDALLSDRPYRKALLPHEAVEMLLGWGEEYFSLEILRSFLGNIAAYPVGTEVLLSNGEGGLVIANTPGFTLRPVIKVLYSGEEMAPHPAPYDLDLVQVLDMTIVKVLL